MCDGGGAVITGRRCHVEPHTTRCFLPPFLQFTGSFSSLTLPFGHMGGGGDTVISAVTPSMFGSRRVVQQDINNGFHSASMLACHKNGDDARIHLSIWSFLHSIISFFFVLSLSSQMSVSFYFFHLLDVHLVSWFGLVSETNTLSSFISFSVLV